VVVVEAGWFVGFASSYIIHNIEYRKQLQLQGTGTVLQLTTCGGDDRDRELVVSAVVTGE
jgi:hypothetical protein